MSETPSPKILIIIPYRRNFYHHRVSRLAIEAAGRGIPIIYTTRTWSGEVAELAGCGVPIMDEIAGEFALAFIHAINSNRELKVRAEVGASCVIKY